MAAKKVVSTALAAAATFPFGSVALREVKSLQSEQNKRDLAPVDDYPWSYQAVPAWAQDIPDCKGSSQSPIDFLSSDVVAAPNVEGGAGTLGSKFTSMPRKNRNITNNGHGLNVEGDFGTLVLPDGVYQVQDFHFHFPSEHAVNQKLYDGELQITLQRVGETDKNSMAIIGIFLEGTDRMAADLRNADAIKDHINFFKHLGLAEELPGEGESKQIEGTVNLNVLKPLMHGNYFHYMGSLSEPPCAETVHWYVLQQPAGIDKAMIENYQSMFRIATNRPVQKLNGRKVAQNSVSVPGEEWKALDDQLVPMSVLKEMREQANPLAGAEELASVQKPKSWQFKNEEWNQESQDCRGSAQSPIDIITSEVGAADQGVSLLHYMNYTTLENLQIFNNGHTLQVDAPFGTLQLPDGLYEAKQFHFHFPAEHAIDHVHADGEIHVVHQKVGADGTEGLAVIAILLQDQDLLAKDFSEEKGVLERGFLNRLGFGHTMPKENEKMTVAGKLSLTESFSHGLSSGFYHYEGSLTTPPCTETVHWYVLERPSLVDKNIIASFKRAFEGQPEAEVLADGRPVQPLNERKVVNTGISIPGEFAHKARKHTD